jgi:putative nucleotidyltransferase with HDIG domain
MNALYFEATYGRERLERVYASLKSNVPLEYALDTRNFISFEFLCRLVGAMAADSGDPQFARKCGLSLASPRALGFAYYMLRALGSPRLCYEETIRLSSSFNKVGVFTLDHLGDTQMVLRYRSRKPEPDRHLCEGRMGQFAAFPTIWGLPPATVVERQCQVHGAPECVYQLSWFPNYKPLVPALVGAAIGALGGVAINELTQVGLGIAAAFGISVGASLALALGYRWQALQKSKLLNEQYEGVVGSMDDLERRFNEIQQLNASLEGKVEARTRELSTATDKLQAALAKAVELDKAKTIFFTNISHELRTPLTLMLAPLETALDEGGLPADHRRQLELMHRNGLRLLKNINQILDLSRLDAGKARLRLQDTDPVALVRGLVESSQGLAIRRGITLAFSATSPEGTAIPLDRDKVDKIAMNLIGNALKFTSPREGAVARITVQAGVVGDRFTLIVADTGIGIPASELETIFDRFSQVDLGDNREFGGTGIGLALVRELTEFHMGTIKVASTEGAGSRFEVALPTRSSAYPEQRVDRRREQRSVLLDRRSEEERLRAAEVISDASQLALSDLSAEEPRPPVAVEPPSAARPTLLLADDNRDMLQFLSQLLARDYRVVTASDGDAAFRTAMQEKPSIVVSDVMMPRRSGYELVKDLRAEERTRHIPIILVTAKAELTQKIQGLEEGADDYLTKPFSFLELKARIKSLLTTRSLERQLAERNEYLSKVNFDLVLSKKEVFLQTIEALAFALEAKDPYTHGHSRRVSILGANLARDLKMSEAEVERVRIAAVLHDIGKLGVPESVLRKPAKLSPEEWKVIEMHPTIGAKILEGVKDLREVTTCIRHHHERWDGSGYPHQLLATAIPYESRIVSVVDTYDAMTSSRPYRAGLPHQRAIDEVRTYSGKQFDPDVVRSFLRLYEAAPPQFPEFPSVFEGL